MLALLAVFVLPLAASASHQEPSLPLTTEKVKALSACWNDSTGKNTDGGLLTSSGIPPDRQVNPSDNRTQPGTTQSLALWANATSYGKQEVLEISSSESVFDGRVVSRSHMIIKGQLDQFRHGVEYGLRTNPPDKPALSVDGSEHCFEGSKPSDLTGATNPAGDVAGTPAQIPRTSPPQPDGFPVDFDPNNNNIFHEHFAPGSDAANAAGAQYYQCTKNPPVNTVPLPALCSDGKLTADVQGPAGDLADGLYYVEDEVAISASNLQAKVTIVTRGKLKVSGQKEAVFTAFTNNLLFMSELGTPNTDLGADAIILPGSDGTYQGGHIFAPNGKVKSEGSRNSFFCAVLADTIYWAGQHNYVSNKQCEAARLSINKTTPASAITIGDKAVFDILVTNISSITATSVEINDELPTGSGNNLAWEVVGGAFTTDPTKCAITGTPLHILKCSGFDLTPAASFKVRVQTKTAVAASDCYTRLNNTAKAKASNAPEVSDSEFIDVNCGAIKINKFRKVPGQASTQPVDGAGFTLFDGNTAVSAEKFTGANGVAGVACFDRLQLNKELTVRETTVPFGLAGAADTKATPTANSQCGDGNEKTLNIENLPKTDLTITAKPQIDNATQTIVKCWKPGKNPNTDPPDFQKTLTTADDTLTILDLLPQILTCKLDIDP